MAVWENFVGRFSSVLIRAFGSLKTFSTRFEYWGRTKRIMFTTNWCSLMWEGRWFTILRKAADDSSSVRQHFSIALLKSF
jgi:hypothetical protein